MAVNDKIRTVDYNTVQTKISNLIGVGSGSTGWGQPLNSSPVTVSSKITVNEWANLRNDIINGFRHINSGTPSTVQAVANNTIKYNDTGSTPEQATEVVVQYDRWADQLVANRFAIHPTQEKTVTKASSSQTWPGPEGTVWRNRLVSTVTVTFTTADQARYFFNSGGEIRIQTTRTGGTTTDQTESWRTLLISAGNLAFGAQKPESGFVGQNGKNFYRLTDNYQEWASRTSSSPYTVNTYRISARTPGVQNNSTGTARIIEFLIELKDRYEDPDGPTNIFGSADAVDGTFTVTVSTLEAAGVLVPAGLGTFTVESPAVVVTPLSSTTFSEQWFRSTTGDTNTLESVRRLGNTFVAVGNNATVLSSTTGITWEVKQTTFVFGFDNLKSNLQVNDVAILNGLYVAATTRTTTSGTVGYIFQSENLVNWFARLSANNKGGQRIIRGGDRFVALFGLSDIVTSVSGVDDWMFPPTNLPSLRQLWDVAFNGSLYVVVGNFNTVLTSPDAINWTVRLDGGLGEDFLSVVWTGSQWLVAATGNKVYRSTDGITWSLAAQNVLGGAVGPTPFTLSRSGNRIMAGGTNGFVSVSTDNGTTWVVQNTGLVIVGGNPAPSLLGSAGTNNKFVAVGSSGAIISSPPI